MFTGLNTSRGLAALWSADRNNDDLVQKPASFCFVNYYFRYNVGYWLKKGLQMLNIKIQLFQRPLWKSTLTSRAKLGLIRNALMSYRDDFGTVGNPKWQAYFKIVLCITCCVVNNDLQQQHRQEEEKNKVCTALFTV